MRGKIFILNQSLGERVAQLLKCSQKYLQLSTLSLAVRETLLTMATVALKFFRQCINQQDEEWHRNLILKSNLLEPILDIVYATMPRDNLLNSVCLDLFEFIKKENIKPLIEHLVEGYREKLERITYIDTFESLITRYEQLKEYEMNPDATMVPQGSDTTQRPMTNGDRRWQGLREADAAEEAYFNTSDDEEDEEDGTWRKATARSLSNGTPLVDYPDDEEDVLLSQFPDPGPLGAHQTLSKKDTVRKLEPEPLISQGPPERISEKRRRADEDDEDELSKFSTSKRRNSASSVSSTGSSIGGSHPGTLRRKRPFSMSQKDSPASGKKLEISLTLKPSIPTEQSEGAG